MTRRIVVLCVSVHGQPRPACDGAPPIPCAPDDTLQMDEDTFRGFYTRTSGMLWAYLARATGDASAADDLLQEAYYRMLRTTDGFRVGGSQTELPVSCGDEPDSRPLSAAARGQRAAAGKWRRRHTRRRGSREADPAAHRSAARHGAADAARAPAGVARVRPGIVASGNCGHAGIENGKHQAAAVSRTAEACADTANLPAWESEIGD